MLQCPFIRAPSVFKKRTVGRDNNTAVCEPRSLEWKAHLRYASNHSELKNHCCEEGMLASDTKPLESACQPHIERHREKKYFLVGAVTTNRTLHCGHFRVSDTVKVLQRKIDCTLEMPLRPYTTDPDLHGWTLHDHMAYKFCSMYFPPYQQQLSEMNPSCA
jgi:hypothetical protein